MDGITIASPGGLVPSNVQAMPVPVETLVSPILSDTWYDAWLLGTSATKGTQSEPSGAGNGPRVFPSEVYNRG
ncbi:hypothetical protein D3C72_1867410 [compost metagenome]